MEPLYENTCIMTKEVYTAFAKTTWRRYGGKSRTLFLVLAVVLLPVSVLMLLDKDFFMTIYALILATLLIFCYFFGYLLALGRGYRTSISLLDADLKTAARFYEDELESCAARSSTRIEYSKITEILETKDLLFLMIGDKKTAYRGIILNKEGFDTPGGYPSFCRFIREKCPGAVFKPSDK